MRGFVRVIREIAGVTFTEIVRDKVLYNAILCVVLLLGAGFLASRLTFTRPERIVLDFGLSACSLSILFISILFGATLLPREFDRRTALVALSKPVTRFEFVVGKFSGLSVVIAVNALILSAAFLLTLFLSGGTLPAVLLVALFFAMIQGMMAGAVALLFSTFSTTSLSVVLSLGVYLIGINVSQLRYIASKVKSPAVAWMIEAVAWAMPNFESFGLGTKVTYGLSVSPAFCVAATAYGAAVVVVVVSAAGVILGKREI